MPRLTVILLSLAVVLAIATAGLANEVGGWTISGGVERQHGRYEFAPVQAGNEVFQLWTAVPTLRYRLEAVSRGPWRLSAFYGLSDPAEAWVCENFLKAMYGFPRDEFYGRSEVLGLDVGYERDADRVTLRPVAGFRRTAFLAGTRSWKGDYWVVRTDGLRIDGLRLGLESRAALTPRLKAGVTAGFSPIVKVCELRLDAHYPKPSRVGDEYAFYRWEPRDQSGSAYDIGLELDYRLNERCAVNAGFGWESGSCSFDLRENEGLPPDAPRKCRAEGFNYSSSLSRLGLTFHF